MKTSLPLLLIALMAFACRQQPLQLFNGKDLNGWHADVPEMDTSKTATSPFIVRNGMLVSLGTPDGHL
ncbi:MAG: DUF1080 domain-containing protein, partial [Cytophagales bacterium]